MNSKRLLGLLGFLFVLMGLTGAGWAAPSMYISGQLLDANGAPIHYYEGSGMDRHEIEVNLAAELKFYDSEEGGTALQTSAVTAGTYRGSFSIGFKLPNALLALDKIFYTLALDTGQDGLTADDLFAGRFEIGAVPFALSAQPSHSYTTHGGRADSARSFRGSVTEMNIAPFESPSGGVEFNKMNIFVHDTTAHTSFSFGIYDEQGRIVTSSGLVSVGDADIANAFLEVKLPQTVRLEPTKIYYTGLATSSLNLDVSSGVRPSDPVFGNVPIPTTDGSVPNSFDPGTLDSESEACALPITLTLVAAPPAPARQGVDATKPQVRWFFTKDSKVVKTSSKPTVK